MKLCKDSQIPKLNFPWKIPRNFPTLVLPPLRSADYHTVWLWGGNPLMYSWDVFTGKHQMEQNHNFYQTLLVFKYQLTSDYFHPPVHSSSHTLWQYVSLQQAPVLFLSCRGIKAHISTRINVHMWEMHQFISSLQSLKTFVMQFKNRDIELADHFYYFILMYLRFISIGTSI